jgi:tRNA pseudouridine38-40 synthase
MMSKQKFYYLIEFQYLGFRYHGWQKQPDVKTIQGMVDKTITLILGHTDFNTLGASRTDASVSANHSALELFTWEKLDPGALLEDLNLHLPNDIKAVEVEEVSGEFNIIQHSKIKEYLYLFSFGEKNHPFCAPFMVYMREHLDIELMKKGATLFEGLHNFQRYCSRTADNTIFEREILFSAIKENDIYTANFFPKNSYVFQVRGKGFLRHQVRLMMGVLFDLGKGKITLDQLKGSLRGGSTEPLSYMAPASGLILDKVIFEHKKD